MHKCWLCTKVGATIRTKPEPPDYEVWWFHADCYWQFQELLY